MMALDECCPGDADHAYARKSLDLTKSWLERYAARFRETEPLYGYSQTFFPMDQVFLPGTIRDRIKDLMKSTKMTQAELAVRIGTAERTLSRFLRGDTDKLGNETSSALPVCLMSLRIFCLAKSMCQAA